MSFRELESSNGNDVLISVDTIKVDDHLRVTLTRNLRKLLSVQEDDIIAVFQNRINNDLVLKIQRQDKVVDTWTLQRRDEFNNNLPDTSTPARATIALRKGDGTRRNVMIIDDDPSVLLTLKTMLGEDKFNVDVFEDSNVALEHFIEMNSTLYDIVITDIRMPPPNGVQLYKRLKEIDSDIKVMFCSALDAAQEILSIFPDIKESDILTKPILQKALVSAIDSKLSEKPN